VTSLLAEILHHAGLPSRWEHRAALMLALAGLVDDPDVKAAAERVRAMPVDSEYRTGRPVTRWTRERLAEVGRARQQGVGWPEIAERCEVSVSAVQQAAKRGRRALAETGQSRLIEVNK